MNRGRVLGLEYDRSVQDGIGTSYYLFDGDDKKYEFKDALNNIQLKNVLNQTFFSQRNVDILQNNIRKMVFEKLGYLIGRQSDVQLEIIMRSIFLQYARNLPYKIKEQIQELNKMVLDFSVNEIIVNIKSYVNFKDEITNDKRIFQKPLFVSSKGSKTLKGNALLYN